MTQVLIDDWPSKLFSVDKALKRLNLTREQLEDFLLKADQSEKLPKGLTIGREELVR